MSLVSNRKSSVARDDELEDLDEEDEERADELGGEGVRAQARASLPLIDLGIRCTLSQLIETGVMHADPHGGNLLRLRETGELAYLDFGLVSEIPPTVRDGLVAAVTLLVFDRDYEAVAGLFGELQLVPRDVIENEYQFAALVQSAEGGGRGDAELPRRRARSGTRGETEEEARLRRAKSAVPDVRFDQLLGALLALVPKYRFLLPPYFLNNARALGTLEGMARTADPNFNILRHRLPLRGEAAPAEPHRVARAAKGAPAAHQQQAHGSDVPDPPEAHDRGRRRVDGRVQDGHHRVRHEDQRGMEARRGVRLRGGVLVRRSVRRRRVLRHGDHRDHALQSRRHVPLQGGSTGTSTTTGKETPARVGSVF